MKVLKYIAIECKEWAIAIAEVCKEDKAAAYANAPEQFPSGNVPIAYAAEKMGKDACFIRAGIEAGWLPIGYAFRKTGKSRTNYYISPKLFWEVTGILWRPEKGA